MNRSILKLLQRCQRAITAAPSTLALLLALVAAPLVAQANPAQQGGRSLRIGIIGSGAMGGPLGLLWAEAGHQVLYSSRNPDQLMDLVRSAAPRASAAYPDAAAFFGEVILLAVPPGAVPQIGEDIGHLMEGKVVIDLGNPREDRDGPLTHDWMEMGTGLAMAQYLPGVRLVKAFNTVNPRSFRNPIRDGERIGVPIAGDDDEAVAITAMLVRDAGLDPVVVGPLARAKDFDRGSPVWETGASAREIRETLAVTSPPGQERPQTQTDDFTRYELQEPGSAAFRIFYDVSATTPGAIAYYNGIRAGAEEEVHGVTDLHTGDALAWEVVDGRHARANGHPRANLQGHFIKVTLARPVPDGGQGRVRIDKTYVDAASYFTDGDDIIFERSLGIRRNAVVLPGGYELVEANYPVQVETEGDGRIRVSFMNPGPGGVPFRIRARPLANGGSTVRSALSGERVPVAGGGFPTRARVDYLVPQRAFEDRDITYFLQQPETHSFRLFHDYTEVRPGIDSYVNVVRAGSSASDPEAYNLDTGDRLEVEQLKGSAITERGVNIGGTPTPESEVVVIWFSPVAAGASVRAPNSIEPSPMVFVDPPSRSVG